MVTCPYDGEALVLADAGGVTAKKVPSGIGRKDLPGYGDKGKANVNSNGKSLLWAEPFGLTGSFGWSTEGSFSKDAPGNLHAGASGSGASFASLGGDASSANRAAPVYYFTAPVSGLYYIGVDGSPYDLGSFNSFYHNTWNRTDYEFTYTDTFHRSISLNKGESAYLTFNYNVTYCSGNAYKYFLNNIPIFIEPLGDSGVTNQNNITINNNTWNGNIYVDNSNNLTYIYPQYTTVNEKNETVTNISTNPIIYNNEEHKYYTYDTVTNNFYYISYGTSDPSATPTPKPTFKPGGGSSRGGGVGRHHGDDGTSDEDWYKRYYILNDYDYDCYYGNFYVDDGQGNTYGKSKTRVSTTAIPIADGTYKVTVPDDVNWRAWRWDADAKVAVPVNSDTWKSSMYYDFYASEDIIFEFRKIDGSQIKPKEIILRLDNPTIVEYEPGGKKHEYSPDPIYPDEQSYIIPQMNSNTFTDSHGTWIASGSTKYGSSYDYFMAFDRSSSTGWCMGDGSGG